jgi:hypothetical protein
MSSVISSTENKCRNFGRHFVVLKKFILPVIFMGLFHLIRSAFILLSNGIKLFYIFLVFRHLLRILSILYMFVVHLMHCFRS